jgi:hypothetical protein
MTLEERVTILENDYWSNHGRLLAIQAALYATAGEPDPELRPTLMEDLMERSQAVSLAQPITAAQLDLVERAREHMTELLQRAFERALLRPEFRQPLPRRR